MRIILSGGGTGGHIYPALAIAGEIKRREPLSEILYVGTAKGLESKIVPASGLDFRTLNIEGINRNSILNASRALVKFPLSFFAGWKIIRDFKPDVIVGTGGYVSYPIVLAGTFFGIRTVIHEQNAFPGLANRQLAARVDCTLLTFSEARKYLNAKQVKVTGLPVRREVAEVNRIKARKNLGIDEKRFTVLAFGGSLGAMSINWAMLDIVERYKNENIQLIWITGENNYQSMKEELNFRIDTNKLLCHLIMMPYMYNIEQAMAVSDLAVCRAGASTLCELELLGLPAILIPYRYAAENHQEKNARALYEKNAADIVIDEYLDGDTLFKKLEMYKNNRQKLQTMSINLRKEARPNALEDIVNEIIK